MKQEIADKWVKALRSGKYKQGKNQLKSAEGYCCLGVLCDLAAKEGIGEWSGSSFDTLNSSDNLTLPEVVQDWTGMKTNNGHFNPQGKSDGISLAGLNDGTSRSGYEGLTFYQIADVIEAYAEEL